MQQRAVIYARFSDHSQREESIEGQLRECKEYAKNNDMIIVGTYIDRALSASKDTEKRLEFQRMIQDSAKGAFDIVLVWKLDRFARNRYDSAFFKHALDKNNVKVVSATERITDGPQGIILESMLEGMAEYYSAELSVKIHRGQKENALKGRNNGGGIPLGYLLGENQKLEVDPLTAPVVLEIFQKYADGETIRSIVESLNERGLKTRKGTAFALGSFNALLKNRKYIGEYQYQDVVIPNGVPAIVPEEIFNQVQRRIDSNRKAPGRSKSTEEYLLSCKLFCGSCGALMIGESGTSKTGVTYYYYKCGNSKRNQGCHKKAVRKDEIEELVVRLTAQQILTDDVICSIAKQVVAYQQEEAPEVSMMRGQLVEAKKKIQNILRAVEDGLYNDSLQQRLGELEAQQNDLEVALAKESLKKPIFSEEDVICWLNHFKKMDLTDISCRKELINCFVQKVFLYDDRLILTFNLGDSTASKITYQLVQSSDLATCAPPRKSLEPPWF